MLAFNQYCWQNMAKVRRGLLPYNLSAHNHIAFCAEPALEILAYNFSSDLFPLSNPKPNEGNKNIAALGAKSGKKFICVLETTGMTGLSTRRSMSNKKWPLQTHWVSMSGGNIETNCISARKISGCSLQSCLLDRKNIVFRLPSRAASSQPNKPVEYKLPSVTWGVVFGRKEKLVSKVIICDYLKSLGIVPDELEDIELPSTVDVMRERVEFLQRIGLNIDDINLYPLMLGCSVRKNMAPVLDYLDKVGIRRQDMASFLRKYPQVLHASVVVDLMPVIRFLRGLDVEREDIPYVLLKYPDLLGFKLDGTMSTSVCYLVTIGVRPRDIGPMVTQYPHILGMRVQTVIKPFVDYLICLGLPKQVVARMIEKRPYILAYDMEESMKPNVESLLTFGIRKEALPSVIAQYPQILGTTLKPKLFSQQYFFNFNIKVDPVDFGRVVEKMPHIVSLPQTPILKRVEFLRGRGFSDEDITKMVVACPQLLAISVEVMKHSFYYFKTEMNRSLQELVEFPAYFTYNLEFRIKPRFQRMSRKGISGSLDWILNCSDQRFEERLESNYIEIEENGPSFSMGGQLKLPGDDADSEEEDEESEDEVFYRRTVTL
ncbi:hypothetical protein SUGI_0258020 [Cryptomeria japonica]|uniref:transcription termination factor MTERF4, chloroplastic n=1 Tax=Cryptomeria japonica TaxID=3369 RepID=UPI002408B67F|nr:transcription termination factor MTERF4, chloroplastic [Cryptomeria japonica]GLJ15685.1 hypothetical protein SUGI_0258020 [Cryptomeria japonica]